MEKMLVRVKGTTPLLLAVNVMPLFWLSTESAPPLPGTPLFVQLSKS